MCFCDNPSGVTGTRKSILITMVTSYGVKENMYSDAVQSHVVMDVSLRREYFTLKVSQKAGFSKVFALILPLVRTPKFNGSIFSIKCFLRSVI